MNRALLPTALAMVLWLAACGKAEKAAAKPQVGGPTPNPSPVQAKQQQVPLKPIEAPPGMPREFALDLGNNVKLELMLIPAGKFMMGRPKVAKGQMQDDLLHEVTISKAFYMGKYEVTQQQYQQVMGTNPSQSKGPDLPVEMVSWDDAQEFCQKVSKKTRQNVRLPTEAEWEYACRAGTSSIYVTGNAETDLDQVGWYDKNSGERTHPVGQRMANGWGLYDMHGNVWEWCQDRQDAYEAKPVTDPLGPEEGISRVHRGGAFGSSADFCRSASRYSYTPDTCRLSIGFRVAVSLSRAP